MALKGDPWQESEGCDEAMAAEVDNRAVRQAIDTPPPGFADETSSVRTQCAVADPYWDLHRRVKNITDRLTEAQRYLDEVQSDVECLGRAYRSRVRALEEAEAHKAALIREFGVAIQDAVKETST